MEERILFAYTALFNTPDEIVNAAKKTSENGYKKYDVNTPYPVHGTFNAMKLPPSKLGYVALAVGLSAALGIILILYWISAIDYPIIIGGKPFFAFPAFIPIIFEVTVLSASIATVLALLFVFFKFPNNSYPLHDTNYMKSVSSDKYGLCILAEDPIFDEDKIKLFMASLGAYKIEPIYFDNEELKIKPKIFEKKFVLFLVSAAVIISGTTYFTLNKLMYMEPFTWMMIQNKPLPQESSNVFEDGFSMRKPVKGTIAKGFMPYLYSGKPEEASVKMINPLLFSKDNLQTGKNKFNIYCSPCHGYFGQGDSRLRGQFPNPPSLHSAKVTNWTDGRIYHVIMEGQNVMPSYSSQLNSNERWAVILYVRALQRSLNAKESDLK
ncbi:MAG: quinol:electron acceptor oxidoreductase subunit ActD [bacterium]